MKLWHTLLVVPSRPTIRRRLDKVKTTILRVLSHLHPIPTMLTLRTQIIIQRPLHRCTRSFLRATHLRLDRLIQLTTIASATRLGGEKKKRVFAVKLAPLLLAIHTRRDL